MSEARFLSEMTQAFTAEHPKEEGWLIHRAEAYAMTFIAALPAFLRAREPRAITREALCVTVEWLKRRDERTSLFAPPYKRAGKGASEEEWYGDLDLLWKGSPVHLRRFVVVSGDHRNPFTLIASKDAQETAGLWAAVRAFQRKANLAPSMMRMIGSAVVKRPKTKWEDLVLPGTMRDEIKTGTETFLTAKRRYKEFGLAFRRGFLFTGPPGCGKTMTVRAIAAQAKARVLCLPLKATTDDYIVKMAFEEAEDLAPSVLILEDLDHLTESEGVSMSYLLNLMDGLVTPEGILIVATTNHPEVLDAALLQRPSRFDKVWHFPLPAFGERLELLRRRAAGKFSEQAVDGAARHSQGFTMAYVQEAVVSALLAALHERRGPRDEDLAESVRRLREQFSSGFKADGALKEPKSVGFAAADEL